MLRPESFRPRSIGQKHTPSLILDIQKLRSSARWQKLRRIYLTHHPLCEMCEVNNKITVANQIHHKIPVRKDINKFFDIQNLKSVCRECHEIAEKKDSEEKLNLAVR